MRTKFKPFYKLNLPITLISDIISYRGINLKNIMYPLNIFEGDSNSDVINKAAQLTNGEFIECLENKNYEKCKQYINGFSKNNSLPDEEIKILACMIKELHSQSVK